MRKGERTAAKILTEAADLFACQGYSATSLRQIANRAGLHEPGLYNHYASKHELYETVVHEALQPLQELLSTHLQTAHQLRDYIELPAMVVDLLHEQPRTASLLNQVLHGSGGAPEIPWLQDWLEQLIEEGLSRVSDVTPLGERPQTVRAINLIALINLITGYFLSQRAFATLADGELSDPDNIERQKALLHRVVRAMLVG